MQIIKLTEAEFDKLMNRLDKVEMEKDGYIPSEEDVFDYIEKHPEKYKKYESPNGWGTIEGCKRFFTWCLKDWMNFCEGYDTRELKDVVHFWIV